MPFRTRALPRPCPEPSRPRRLIALLLLLGSLLLSATACSTDTGVDTAVGMEVGAEAAIAVGADVGGDTSGDSSAGVRTDGRPRALRPSTSLSAERYAPAGAGTHTHGPHSASPCMPGTHGRSPQGRSAAEAAAPALLGAVVPAAAVPPTVRSPSPQRRPAPTGRSTLAALCRCRR
ncbi:hypothetical protein [Streptomyces halobius]|uniref:Lipoprotein n=1 Tax=Streptomyces halobius TaxID=2879846 RepID=A0ABY4M855_9ACTN|nr:hypothetical protein [Streptomyces halobius]UQA92456.1 hypothetical protein K9S39_11955 [Streptomyces halobius]